MLLPQHTLPRLYHLYKQLFDVLLQVELLTAHLEDLVDFDAISSVWGLAIFTETQMINENYIKVTPSLLAVLRRFRLPGRSRLLWADAVCIN